MPLPADFFCPFFLEVVCVSLGELLELSIADNTGDHFDCFFLEIGTCVPNLAILFQVYPLRLRPKVMTVATVIAGQAIWPTFLLWGRIGSP